ncbi:hypothetical protein [Nocardioides sp. J54]|uniref:hypothetical protein n=1 Tax=Nocardioides sp. J54 TaxID=935866 RepID=UPI0004ADD575|nr:hypothetical protein [Nocardioides sp. J54]
MSRVDRYGDPIEDEPEEADRWHDPRCRDGWLGEDLQGRPVPCLQCRPHLLRLLR